LGVQLYERILQIRSRPFFFRIDARPIHLCPMLLGFFDLFRAEGLVHGVGKGDCREKCECYDYDCGY
jgi:hypothetical protein